MSNNTIRVNKKAKIAFIVFLALSILMFLLVIVVPPMIPYMNESTTVEITATVVSVQEQNKNQYTINTQEFGDKLQALAPYVMNWRAIENLQAGQTIWFRVEKNDTTPLSQSPFIAPVTLRTDSTNIITFQSYNKTIDQSKFGGILSGSIFGTIFLLISIYCFLRMKNIKIFGRRNNESNLSDMLKL